MFAASRLFYDNVVKTYFEKNYRFNTADGRFDFINVFGVRRLNAQVDYFNDFICIAHNIGGIKTVKVYNASTLPGHYYLCNPMDKRGCAVLKEGQYPNSHEYGLHKGAPALVQVSPMWLFRNKPKDGSIILDKKYLYNELCGIDIHKCVGDPTHVDKWSAGCQVLEHLNDYIDFIGIVSNAAIRCGNRFTYTLFSEADF